MISVPQHVHREQVIAALEELGLNASNVTSYGGVEITQDGVTVELYVTDQDGQKIPFGNTAATIRVQIPLVD